MSNKQIRVYITIDTEEDQWGEYVSTGTTVDNVTMIPKLQQLFDQFGAVPTYLINYPVVKNETALRIIKEIHDKGRCGIGTHCHPWNTPPLRENMSNHNSMLCNLPYELIYEKLKTLHQAIVDDWGVTPICFRAGRWGFGKNVARSIHELGYKIDTSVTPFSDWREYEGPDFSDAATDRYFFHPDSILNADVNGCLMELPPTIGFLQNDFSRCRWLRKLIITSKLSRLHLIGILDRLRILNLRWLSPELCSGMDMIGLSKACIRNGCRYLNMSFHSTSLMPGMSPFVRSDKDLEIFLGNIRMFLEFAYENKLMFVPLDDALVN